MKLEKNNVVKITENERKIDSLKKQGFVEVKAEDAPAKKAEKPLEKMKKAELLAYAEEKGISLDGLGEGPTNAVILEAILQAEDAPEGGE